MFDWRAMWPNRFLASQATVHKGESDLFSPTNTRGLWTLLNLPVVQPNAS